MHGDSTTARNCRRVGRPACDQLHWAWVLELDWLTDRSCMQTNMRGSTIDAMGDAIDG
eukprot:COSAG01_NODE_48179_length_383_cov_1.450704_2_plen_57_part_01